MIYSGQKKQIGKKHVKPSNYTVLYWLVQDKKIEPESLFNFLEFFWPTFIEKDNYVFLKEAFNEEEYNRLITEQSNPEYWINLLTVDEFFSAMPDWEEKASVFAKALASIWTEKLKKDFPYMNITVEDLCNEEYGDYGITFYQIDKDNARQINERSKEISAPNVKESKIEQSSSGPRPGIPKIRKARANEIPATDDQ